jgi:hypothetical protein
MARKRKDEWKFVEVVWHDATADSAWCDEGDLPDLTVIVSRGWLCRETERAVTLAASIGGSKTKAEVGEVITIPRGCIATVRELKVA